MNHGDMDDAMAIFSKSPGNPWSKIDDEQNWCGFRGCLPQAVDPMEPEKRRRQDPALVTGNVKFEAWRLDGLAAIVNQKPPQFVGV
jgi:hypothetical protein